MSRFRFALQPLFEARESHERECRLDLAAAACALAEERQRARGAHDAFSRAARSFAASATQLPPEAFREALVRLELFERAARSADASVGRFALREESARAAFVRARAERRRIEALRERALAAYETETERRETHALEEANLATHNAVTLSAFSLHN
jgi:flagellar biosynthesis chaperone FliJ